MGTMTSPAVAIGYLERFAADYERESGHMALPDMAPSNGIKKETAFLPGTSQCDDMLG